VHAFVPDPLVFIYSFVRKEAQLSSEIEGTQSSLSELLAHENAAAPGVPIQDVADVANYVAALEHGVARLREGFPISNRLIREMHAVLLRSGRGQSARPGEFRTSQNWIGGTRPGNAHFVPAPPSEVPDAMSELEKFIHGSRDQLPPLVVAAMVHLQFETIHPFLDGNGRIGRMLVTLLLAERNVLREPLLYLSLWLKRNRQVFYELLDSVRATGDWTAWFTFFFEGVRECAASAVVTAQELLQLFELDRARLQGLGRASGNALRVHAELKSRVFVSIPRLAQQLEIAVPTAGRAVEELERLGIAHEITGRKRDRQWAYTEYLRVLADEG